ncbi:MAG: hypothetical protein GDA56_20675 [Hormoscilla sp. GM7CHS1pb]|nr:hypothetical protein [Hormoscilla sp. GM7CHS1pb]
MSTELVVLKNGGAGSALQLDATQMLAEIREILERKGLMTADQFFMVSGHPVHETSEGSTPLSEVLVTPEGQNHPVLTVGVGSANIGQGPDDTVRMWNLMGDGQKLMILNSIVEITKGIALDANGAHKTTHDAITPLANDSLPSSTVPRIQSSVKTKAYFSKYAQSLATSNTNGASLSVSTPFASGSTSFSYAQSHSQSSSGVNTYFVGSYNVNKVVLELDEKKLQLTNNFRTALLTAAAHDQRADEFVGIVKALNQYGWYIVIKLTLGGLLYTTKTEKASSWSQADSHATEFAASFEASFRGIGGELPIITLTAVKQPHPAVLAKLTWSSQRSGRSG